MESSKDVEVMSKAIEKLLDEKRMREANGDAFIEDDDDQVLLSRLISQLESTKPMNKTGETTKEETQQHSPDQSPSKQKHEQHKQLEDSIEEIAKDIKNVKKQNKKTHLLLSALIILTLTWQLSEYSMIFIMKEKLTHPLRSIGNMLSGMFKGTISPIKNKLAVTNSKEQNDLYNGSETNAGVHIQMPEMLREFGLNENDK